MKRTSSYRIPTLLFCLLALLALTPGIAAATHDLETAQAEQSMQWVTLTGYTRADVFFNLETEFAGKVVEVHADVGDTIPPDGIFARLDATFVQLELEAVITEIDKLETRLGYYSKEEERYRKLIRKGNTDQSTYDKFQMEMDTASFELRAKKVEKARLEEELERYVLRVPAGYTVIERSIEPGEWISNGANVGNFGDYRTLVIPYALDQEEFARLQSLEKIQLDFYPVKPGLASPQTREALIKNISPAFDEETRKVQVELAVKPGGLSNRGGLRAELRLPLSDRAGSVLLPEKFIGQKYEDNYVTDKDGNHIPIVVLGKAPGNRLRIYSTKIKAGETFFLPLSDKANQPQKKTAPPQ